MAGMHSVPFTQFLAGVDSCADVLPALRGKCQARVQKYCSYTKDIVDSVGRVRNPATGSWGPPISPQQEAALCERYHAGQTMMQARRGGATRGTYQQQGRPAPRSGVSAPVVTTQQMRSLRPQDRAPSVLNALLARAGGGYSP